MYRLDKLTEVAAELGFRAVRDGDRVDVSLTKDDVVKDSAKDIVLSFHNLVEQGDTLVGFVGTPWHAHGVMTFSTDDSYVELDELELLLGLAVGDVLVVSLYVEGDMRDRWLCHRQEHFSLEHMVPGEELRVFRLNAA